MSFAFRLSDSFGLLVVLQGRRTAVLGSITPWVEALVANHGAVMPITTVEHNLPTCTDDRIRTVNYSSFAGSSSNTADDDGEMYDALVTYSSVEHAGLGR